LPWTFCIVLLFCLSIITDAFLQNAGKALKKTKQFPRYILKAARETPPPVALLVGINSNDDNLQTLSRLLKQTGFESVFVEDEKPEANDNSYEYKVSKATGMLQLVESPAVNNINSSFDAPRWIPMVQNMENILVSNGWSFLDDDESEPISSFDIDASNKESLYKPKWGQQQHQNSTEAFLNLSKLGYNLNIMENKKVLSAAESLGDQNDLTRQTLLNGATDPPKLKRTLNGFDFTGSARQSDIDHGVFACAIGGLPLFSTINLSTSTASSGWLSFTHPISDDHVVLIKPDPDSNDQRIEVVCSKTRCHLGHYFGPGEGYCINGSALYFIRENDVTSFLEQPISWRLLDDPSKEESQLKTILMNSICKERVAFGAGCFWHVEAALRRLPGIINTEVGYAGGNTCNPTYESVCKGNTGHAEVVLVEYDPQVVDLCTLVESFLALHDPTKVRAHGKHAEGTGQYRSCVFLVDAKDEKVADEALTKCQIQLEKELITEVRHIDDDLNLWFWRAEDRHQQYQERKSKLAAYETLSLPEWFAKYGKRSPSILGSAETIPVESA